MLLLRKENDYEYGGYSKKYELSKSIQNAKETTIQESVKTLN